jgi:hypothetical protein
MVFAKGLGLDELLYRFVKLHVDGTRLTLLLNISDQQVSTFNTSDNSVTTVRQKCDNSVITV